MMSLNTGMGRDAHDRLSQAVHTCCPAPCPQAPCSTCGLCTCSAVDAISSPSTANTYLHKTQSL